MGKLKTRFVDWVDAKGEDAGNHMVAGMFIGAIVSGLLGIVLGLATMTAPLIILGFAVFILHLMTAMAVL